MSLTTVDISHKWIHRRACLAYFTYHTVLQVHPPCHILQSLFILEGGILFYCMYTPHFLYHSPIRGCLGCFHVLATANKSAMDVCVCVCMCVCARVHMYVLSCSVASDSVTPRTAAHQAPLSMGFCKQGDWSGLPFPPPRDLPQTWIEAVSESPALASRFFTTSAT